MGVRIGRTPEGRRIEVDRVVDAPATAAWDLLVDTERWPAWGPSVSGVDLDADGDADADGDSDADAGSGADADADGDVDTDERRIGPGTTGRVKVAGVWVPFSVDDYSEEEQAYRWTWRVAGVPATGHRVDPLPDGRCRVVFEVPLLAAGYAVVCRRALDAIERLLVDERS